MVNKDNYSGIYGASIRVGHSNTVIFPNSGVASVTHLAQDEIENKQILSDLLVNKSIKLRATIKYKSNINGHFIDHCTSVAVELRESATGVFPISPQEWT